MAVGANYPVKVEARLDPQLSRWLWLFKWLLAIPHYIVLAFLWIGVAVLSVVAFFAILLTGHYPRPIFEFNVGVFRWSWRVAYYAHGALATDRYPPFTLAEVPDYPAHLEISYPERLSRGLVLIKWWLLALPHLLIVGVLIGGTWVAWQSDNIRWSAPGLIGLLVFFAGVALAFTGRYPRGLFDLILGLNRWVLRVGAYVGLMTDEYPPFRLDMGGDEGGSTLTVPPGGSAPGSATVSSATSTAAARGFGTGSIIAVIAGGLMSLMALGFLAAGGLLLWADQTQRDSAGFVVTPVERFEAETHALVAEDIDIRVDEGPRWLYPSAILGDTRLRVTSNEGSEVFVGIGRADAVARYLDGVGYSTLTDLNDDTLITHEGGAPLNPPGQESIWAESTEGTGTQILNWTPREGAWTALMMNADGSPGVDVRAGVGAELPSLPWIAGGLLVIGGVLMLVGVGLIGGGVFRASRRENNS
jgi:hypothetical protein